MGVSAKFKGFNKGFRKTTQKLSEQAEKDIADHLKDQAIKVHSAAIKGIQKTSNGDSEIRTSFAGGSRRIIIRSKPGDPPNVQTGQLINGIKWAFNREKLEATVGTNVKHGKYMEFGTRHIAPRPWLKPALKKVGLDVRKLKLGGRFR